MCLRKLNASCGHSTLRNHADNVMSARVAFGVSTKPGPATIRFGHAQDATPRSRTGGEIREGAPNGRPRSRRRRRAAEAAAATAPKPRVVLKQRLAELAEARATAAKAEAALPAARSAASEAESRKLGSPDDLFKTAR